MKLTTIYTTAEVYTNELEVLLRDKGHSTFKISAKALETDASLELSCRLFNKVVRGM